MPPDEAPSKIKDLLSSSDKRDDLDFRRSSRHHQPSRFAREKTLSPRVSQSLKFRDKGVRMENQIRPPYGDLPLEFVKNTENGYVVQAKYPGKQRHADQGMKSASNEDELIKYMSKVPKYLQKGERNRDNVLNFGVLDWGRLEQWTHQQSHSSTSNTTSTVHSTADFSPIVGPMKGKIVNPSDKVTSNFVRKNGKDKGRVTCEESKSAEGKEMHQNIQKQERGGKDKSSRRRHVDSKSAKGKEKCVYEDSTCVAEIPSSKPSNLYPKVLGGSVKKPVNCSEHFETRDVDSSSQQCSGENDSIVLILPRDFSKPCSSDMSPKASFLGKSGQHNWGSFSDLFFVDEIHTDDSFTAIPHSHIIETEKDLDAKLDNLIKAQGVDLPDNPPDQNSESNSSDQIAPRRSVEKHRESLRHQRLGYGSARITKSLTFKEGSLEPPLSSMYVKSKSGPAKPEGSASLETSSSSKSGIRARARSGPLKRLLGPLLKPKVVNQMKEQSNDSMMEPPIPVVAPELEKSVPSTVKAFLHLTVKSGLPLFKFVVETNNEILASTVKSVTSCNEDDISLMYTFYVVHKVRKKNSGWKNQKVKPCGFGYNVVGQMKVSKPKKTKDICKVKESVLYSVDVSKTDATSSELSTGTELAAIVVNMLTETGNCGSPYSQFDSNEEVFESKNEKLAATMVILPGGNHSVPREGVPSSLISRWRTGGLCDCGGWDEGCKLRILTDIEDRKGLIRPISRLKDFRCDLYDQEESKQCIPFFRVVPFRDGLFSVEFDNKMSSLQAFSVCVAVINSKQPAEFGATKAAFVPGDGPEIRALSNPPVSPVGRV